MTQEDIEEGPINLKESEYILEDNIQSNSHISILSLNVQSMNNKFDKLRNIADKIKPSLFCMQETWGKNDITDYSITDFHKPIIKCRKGGMNSGGGVGIWVRADLDFVEQNSPFIEKVIESQTIHVPRLNLILINVYRPFLNMALFLEKINEHVSALADRFKKEEIVIVGDFNVDLLENTSFSDKLISQFLPLGLLQRVSIPTRVQGKSKSLIDHAYVRSNKQVLSNVLVTDISDHFATLTVFPKWKKQTLKSKITKRWLTPESYEQINHLLSAETWEKFHLLSVNEMADQLISKITEALDIVAPVEKRKIKSKLSNPWLTTGILISIKSKNAKYRILKKEFSEDRKMKYKTYKKQLDSVIRLSKNMYYKSKIEHAGKDGRALWNIINEVIDRKQSKHSIPETFQGKTTDIKGFEAIASEFNSYFASIGSKMASTIPETSGFEKYVEIHDKCKLTFRELKEEEVEKIMQKQQPKLSCGVDTINNKIVKICAKALSTPMTILINKSIREGKVPTAFKTARVVPLYKKGPANECGNYRPVSLLSALSKILEKSVCSQLTHYLSKNKLICNDQYGFRSKSGTTHVVQNFLNVITEASIENKVTIATFIDLSKAFDCLQYDKLFYKLECLGVQGLALSWFQDYLSNRIQQVEVEGFISNPLSVQLGIPQGSILGPVLFLIYVNDINNSCTDISFTKFADDTTMLATGKTLEEAMSKMNSSLELIDIWFKSNKLNLNPSKTRYMIFNHKTDETNLIKIRDEYIERVWDKGKEKSFRLVGIEIDEKLKWTEHINKIGKKLNSAIYGLTRVCKTLDIHNKKLLYSGLIHSHLVYGLPIWGFATKGRLETLLLKQKKAIRKIFNLKYRDHTEPYFRKADILKLPQLIDHTALCYIQASLDKTSPLHIRKLWKERVLRENLRQDNKVLEYPLTSRQWINNLAPIAQAKLWNSDPQIKDVEIPYFKKVSKFHFIKDYEELPEQLTIGTITLPDNNVIINI
jgi:hypothetical protein